MFCGLAFPPVPHGASFGPPPSPCSLIFQHKTQHPLIPLSAYLGNSYSPPVVHTPMLSTTPQYTPVEASGDMAPLQPSLGHPNLALTSNSSVHLSFHQPNPPFDDCSTPLQSAHHPTIRVAPNVPTRAEAMATATLGRRHILKPLPSHLHDHPSLPPMRNSSHPHPSTIANDPSSANALAMINVVVHPDDKL